VSNRAIGIIVAGVVIVGGVIALFYATAKPAVPPPASSPVVEVPARSAAPSPTPTPAREPAPASKPAAKPVEPSPTPEPSPTTGTLVIESDVPDTSVMVDRVFLGKAPQTATGLTPGPHRINLTPTGYEGIVETVDVTAGTNKFSYSFKEIKLDASDAVIHKHAIGSCNGTLRATPKGITYDTTNKNDAFSAPLTDLETFTMDYLEKKLTVKIKGGKTYVFSDADGDVNRLFLFHKDTDKARQRLISGR
jgi:hypothetical protein